MIVKREKLSLWERLYLPAIIGGFKVTLRHFFRKKVTMQYPEEKWVVPPGYRGAPYLVRDQEGNTKCVSCQLCEFVCPPKAIRIVPPGPAALKVKRNLCLRTLTNRSSRSVRFGITGHVQARRIRRSLF